MVTDVVTDVTTADFAMGQRWLSETEMEQGLGVITQVQDRTVAVLFPATGEMRHYARRDAPLARYHLLVDERGQHADGWYFRVTEVTVQDGVINYQAQREDDGDTVVIAEVHLAAQVAANHPLTRILAGKVDRLDLYRLRHQAQQYLQQWQQNPAAGLLGARANVLAHQIFIAATVADRFNPRVLLADEVGLGKTIEAGLILQRRLLTGRSERVLIVVPDSLAHQWIVELLRRFNLRFSLFDQERCEQAALDADSVFATEQLVIVPQSLLTHKFWSLELLEVNWDLLLVDEAHQLTPATPAFSKLSELCEAIGSVILLTATPEQAGAEAHFARLQLLDPDRFSDFASFQQEQQHYQTLAPQAAALAAAGKDAELDQLLDHYGTGRVMFRNSRSHVGQFPQRVLHPQRLTPEQNKLDWLIELLKQHKQQKFVLICRHTDQVLLLQEQLRVKTGIHAAVFHEQLTLLERDRAAAYFASPEEGCPLLICSEIGSEGRNFQCAQHLILFDLPNHPDLLEQRIGRLDRIGQQDTIHLHVPIVADSAEAALFAWYQAMDAFNQPNAVGAAIYDQLHDQVLAASTMTDAEGEDNQLLDELIIATETMAADLREQVQAGRDRLQELNACRPHQVQPVLDAICAADDYQALQAFMEQFWDRFGIDYDVLNDSSGWLRPTEQLRVPIAGLPEEGVTVTFARGYALQHEDVEFLSWDHPFVQQALELLSFDSYGSTCVAQLKNRALPAGTWFIELQFVSTLMAPKALQAHEFYPQQRIRVLLDSQGRDLTAKVAAAGLDKQLLPLDKKQARGLLKQLRGPCQQAIKTAWSPAEQAQSSFVATAATAVEQQLAQQLARLEQLQQHNPLVRDSEINAVRERREQLLQALTQPVLQLDAVRVMVNIPA
ncbi:SNF2-related protein [Pseudidiomarina sp. PP-1MA]|uniref:RNA polymerase-associated protein RapA n=1 Tax=Pseudidiomarina sp. PP-1MA TaxID=3237706 RepID=A0AB39X7D0_9GAMM